ncbi:tetraspanin-18B [Diachasmimorpha longicaudata]|uniref:tetraspanin-18B n=1 Tax=Diachasmimorpha longicaudata TaxID=58733 RepID=UPI0030B87EB8
MGYGTEMSGCGRFMKYSLFFANFVIFVGGCVVAGLAVWAMIDKIPYISDIVGNNLLTGAVYVLLAGGIIVAIVAFFGCIGASREVKCMLLTYFIIVLILFVTIFIGGVLAYVFRGKLNGRVEMEMQNSMGLYDSKPYMHEAWDTTQRSLRCCGTRSFRDWSRVGLPLPRSCCREVRPGEYFYCNATPETPNQSNTYFNGCLTTVEKNLEMHTKIIGAAGIAVAILMLFGMIFSCALFRKIE